MRQAQGFSVGGEYTGSMAYASEVSPHGRRGLLSSLATTGTMMGILLSTMAVWLVRSLVGDDALSAWDWRIPFLLGLVVTFFGVMIRTRIPETLHEDTIRAERKIHAFAALREHWRDSIEPHNIVDCVGS